MEIVPLERKTYKNRLWRLSCEGKDYFLNAHVRREPDALYRVGFWVSQDTSTFAFPKEARLVYSTVLKDEEIPCDKLDDWLTKELGKNEKHIKEFIFYMFCSK